MGNFGLIVILNYASLYQKTCAKDFFQILQQDRAQKFSSVKFPSKIVFWAKSWPNCGPPSLLSQDLL